MKLHREGLRFTFIYLGALALLGLTLFLTRGKGGFLIVLIVFDLAMLLFTMYFFRSPKRLTVASETMIYAPADGKIVTIEKVYEPEVLQQECLQVSIFMSVWNVHVNRCPIAGRVSYYKYHPGKFLMAWNPKSSTDNERTTIVIDRVDGRRILLRQIAGAVARRIVTYVHKGQEVRQDQELGFIKFGSRVDLFLPLDSQLHVSIGDKVVGGITAIASM